jgi:hypothetical protein
MQCVGTVLEMVVGCWRLTVLKWEFRCVIEGKLNDHEVCILQGGQIMGEGSRPGGPKCRAMPELKPAWGTSRLLQNAKRSLLVAEMAAF